MFWSSISNVTILSLSGVSNFGVQTVNISRFGSIFSNLSRSKVSFHGLCLGYNTFVHKVLSYQSSNQDLGKLKSRPPQRFTGLVNFQLIHIFDCVVLVIFGSLISEAHTQLRIYANVVGYKNSPIDNLYVSFSFPFKHFASRISIYLNPFRTGSSQLVYSLIKENTCFNRLSSCK